MSSERVWNKTNRLAGKLFKAAGILAMLGAAFYQYAIFFIMMLVILSAIIPCLFIS